jgi:hypothetical protein
MVAPLRHRQTKEAETDMFDLQPPRHISTLHIAFAADAWGLFGFGELRTWPVSAARWLGRECPDSHITPFGILELSQRFAVTWRGAP